MQAGPIETLQRTEWVDATSFSHTLEVRSEQTDAGFKDLDFKGLCLLKSDSRKGEAATGGGQVSIGTNERLHLGFGPLKLRGLPYELTGPFKKPLGSNSRRRPTSAILNSEASPSAEPELLVWAETDRRRRLRGRAGSYRSSEGMDTYFAGFDGGETGIYEFWAEAFQGNALLPSRSADCWFSDEPPLPERALLIRAVTASLAVPQARLFLCGAASQCEARGRGAYAQTAIDIVQSAFRFSAAADGTTERFVDAGGDEIGDRLRYWGEISSRILCGSVARAEYSADYSAGLEKPPSQHFGMDIHFQTAKSSSLFRLTESTVAVERKPAEDADAVERLQASLRFANGRARTTLSFFIAETTKKSAEKTGFSVKTATPIGNVQASWTVGMEADGSREIRWKTAVGAAAPAKGGLFRIDFGTDAPATLDDLCGTEKSRSPLGPWTLKVSWVFRERLQSRSLGLQ